MNSNLKYSFTLERDGYLYSCNNTGGRLLLTKISRSPKITAELRLVGFSNKSHSDDILIYISDGRHLIVNLRSSRILGYFTFDMTGHPMVTKVIWLPSGRFCILSQDTTLKRESYAFMFDLQGNLILSLHDLPVCAVWHGRADLIKVDTLNGSLLLINLDGIIVQHITPITGYFNLKAKATLHTPNIARDRAMPNLLNRNFVAYEHVSLPEESELVVKSNTTYIHLWRTNPEEYLRITRGWLRERHLPESLILNMLRQI